jgi:hypothetical protein
MTGADLDKEIAKLEQRRKDLAKLIVHTFDASEMEEATKALQRTKARLGRLLLARDKQQRPEVYR